MPAKCQACEVGVKALPNGIGTKGDPFGGCSNCDAFACGHHGHRDGNVPEFMCVECDPKLLVASAAVAAGQVTAEALAGYRGQAWPVEVWAVRSPDDFLARRPGYGPGLMQRFESTRRELAFEARRDVPPNARDLLLLAGVVAETLGVSGRDR
jgi:hypothetical protein